MKLSRGQEIALCNYIDRLDRVNLSLRKELIAEAANFILQDTAQPNNITLQTVGLNWVTRFVKRHHYRTVCQKTLDKERQEAEDIEVITKWYRLLKETIDEHGIQPADIWNMDETGFCIGVGKDQMVVTRKSKSSYLGIPTNRESATAIEAISTSKQYIPAFLILSGAVHLGRWYEIQTLDPDTTLTVSLTGYSNDELSLAWIQHFQKHTANKTVSKKRLLILDDYGSHHTIQFINYYISKDIIPFGLPPYTTHILQPLDVVIFQPLKHYHSKAVDILIREGCFHITKTEFLGFIQSIREQAFKSTTILSAFRKTGIYPFKPTIVLEAIKARNTRYKTPNPPSNTVSSPFQTPLTIRKLNRIGKKLLQDVKSNIQSQQQLAINLERYIKGAKAQGTELRHIKYEPERTSIATELLRKNRNAIANRKHLQAGGVLTVAEGRDIIKKREVDEEAKARRVIELAEQRRRRQAQYTFQEAAKLAKKWRIDSILEPHYIIDGKDRGRFLRRR
jgi:hypothetical protein